MAPHWLMKEHRLAEMRRKELLDEAALAHLIAAHPPAKVDPAPPRIRSERRPLAALLRLVARFKAPIPAR